MSPSNIDAPPRTVGLSRLAVAASLFFCLLASSPAQALLGLPANLFKGLLSLTPTDPPTAPAISSPQTLQTAQGPRYFLAYRPMSYAPGRPVVVALHGGSLSYDIVLDNNPFAALLNLADEAGFLLIVPNGTNGLLQPGAAGWADGNSQSWNDCRPSNNRMANDVGFLSALIVVATDPAGPYAADPARVFVIGQSNGGFMAQRMALERPNLLRAVGSALSNVAADSQCTNAGQPVPIVLINGDQDIIIPWTGTLRPSGACGPATLTGCILSAEASRDFWLDYNGTSRTSSVDRLLANTSLVDGGSRVREMVYDTAADSPQQIATNPVLFYRAQAAGHIEPSRTFRINAAARAALGNQNLDVEGYGLMWSFFESLP